MRQEYKTAEVLKVKYPVSLLLKVMDINPSGYYKWLKRKDTPNNYEQNCLDLTALLLEKSKRHKSWGYHRLAQRYGKKLAGYSAIILYISAVRMLEFVRKPVLIGIAKLEPRALETVDRIV